MNFIIAQQLLNSAGGGTLKKNASLSAQQDV
jgi:hypothetical protein